jgi:hypothetical protein
MFLDMKMLEAQSVLLAADVKKSLINKLFFLEEAQLENFLWKVKGRPKHLHCCKNTHLFLPLSLSLSFSLCLSLPPSLYFRLSLSLSISLCLSLPPSLSIFGSLSPFPCPYLSLSLSFRLSISLFPTLYLSRSFRLSISISFRLSISFSLSLYPSLSLSLFPSLSISLSYTHSVCVCVSHSLIHCTFSCLSTSFSISRLLSFFPLSITLSHTYPIFLAFFLLSLSLSSLCHIYYLSFSSSLSICYISFSSLYLARTLTVLSLCLAKHRQYIRAGKPYWSGRLSIVDLLVLTSLDQQLFTLKILFTFVTKQAKLMRRSTVLSLPVHLIFPDQSIFLSNLSEFGLNLVDKLSTLKNPRQYNFSSN